VGTDPADGVYVGLFLFSCSSEEEELVVDLEGMYSGEGCRSLLLLVDRDWEDDDEVVLVRVSCFSEELVVCVDGMYSGEDCLSGEFVVWVKGIYSGEDCLSFSRKQLEGMYSGDSLRCEDLCFFFF